LDKQMVIELFETQDIEQNRVIAALSYFLFFLPLVFRPRSSYARFHANQALVLWLASFVGNFVLKALPIIGRSASDLFSIAMLILMVLGILHAIKGEAKRLLFIGHIDILR
jgi:uncharacterized membrane protein